jgi:hypothetical protein
MGVTSRHVTDPLGGVELVGSEERDEVLISKAVAIRGLMVSPVLASILVPEGLVVLQQAFSDEQVSLNSSSNACIPKQCTHSPPMIVTAVQHIFSCACMRVRLCVFGSR